MFIYIAVNMLAKLHLLGNNTTVHNSTNKMISVCYANLLSSQICLGVTENCNKPLYRYKTNSTYYNTTKNKI